MKDKEMQENYKEEGVESIECLGRIRDEMCRLMGGGNLKGKKEGKKKEEGKDWKG